MTTAAPRKLFKEHFSPDCVTVEAYGNVLSTVAHLHGLVSEDFFEEEFYYHDPDIEWLSGESSQVRDICLGVIERMGGNSYEILIVHASIGPALPKFLEILDCYDGSFEAP